ncbi:MAG: amino acid adenylation domain-containing protein [Candidatus Aminicenantes bacterium]|jgi:amino acid adenylation domain-containing protein
MELLLDKLIRKGVRFSSANDQLKIQLGNISLLKEESEALRANKKEIIAYLQGSKISCLSYAQERLWFIAQLGYSQQYHIPKIVKIRGNLDQEALKKTMNFIAARHESLRTGFGKINGTAVQIIAGAVVIGIEQIDLSGLSNGEQDQVRQTTIREFIQRPFELEKAPLMRVMLIRLKADKHILGICLHHIIFDGWSMGILLREINQVYASYREGKEPGLAELKIQYTDYAVWQREVMTETKLDKELNYWKKHLAGYEDLNLPTDYPRPKYLSGKGGYVSFRLQGEEARPLKKLCQKKQMTLFTALIASVYILLRQYSRQEDICLGMPVTNRDQPELENLIGFFVNTQVIRINTEGQGDITVEQLLKKVNEESAAGRDRRNVPFEKIVETIQPTRDLSRTPIFQVMVNYINTKREEPQLGESQLEAMDYDYEISKFDLTLALAEREEGDIGIYLEYNRDLYQEETVKRMGEHLIKIMTALVESPGKTIEEIELLTAEEKQKLLVEWNDTAARYPRDKCIHQLFEEQVKKTPGNVAGVFEDQKLTYRELDERSSGLAVYLQKQGITSDSLVGICLERSLEMIVGILGITKAGGAYMPISPEFPPARIRYMVADSNVRVLLTTAKLQVKAEVEGNLGQPSGLPLQFINMETVLTSPHEPPLSTLTSTSTCRVSPANLAYGIYTSGSTGKPKGVMIEHQAICNRIIWMQEQYKLTQKDRVLQKTPFSFDVSVWEFFWPLMAGARLIFALPDKHKEPDYLAGLIEKKKITTLHFVPSMLRAFLGVDHWSDKASSIKRLICSGEPLSKDLKDNFMAKLDCELHNLYGPTEAAVDVSYWKCQKEYPWGVPIGRPIANTQLYILGINNKPGPVGVPGELHIAGAGLARGYLNQPELTAEKFILAHSSWLIADRKATRRAVKFPMSYQLSAFSCIYKTGDLARWLPDGNIDYLGRLDHQLKIRGFRIELGEIETGLAQHPGVREALVLARTINNTTQLVAYYVPGDRDKILEASEIRDYLRKTLPDYMIPAAFVSLEQVPLTPNGKINRKALLQLEVGLESSREYAEPRTETEKQLASIWEEVLGIGRVGIYDNFFQLGGHSLLAIQIISRINKELGVEVLLGKLFESPNIEGLSRVIAESNPYQAVPIASIRRPVQLPLSYAQERLWFLAQLGYSEQYHIPKAVKIKGDLDEKALQKTINFIAARHESLRTGFKTVEGTTIQFIAEAEDIKIEQRDLSAFSKEEQAQICQNIIREFVQRPFQLEQPPLIRFTLLKLEATTHILGMCLHHIISDAWSMGILTREINQAYAAYTRGREPGLVPLKVQYADYAVWQRQVMTEENQGKELSSRIKHLAGYENLDMPIDYPRPKQLSGKGGYIVKLLKKEQVQPLKKLCQEKQMTLFTLLMTSVYILLMRYSRKKNICLGFPEANRNHQEIEDLVGFFINTLVIRIDTEKLQRITVWQLLKKVQEEIVAAQDRQDVSFEKVVEAIQPTRDLSRSPIFQVLVNYVNTGREELQLRDSQLEGVHFDYGISKFDLTFAFVDHTDGGVRINLEYSQDLYREETIKRMGGHLVKIMTSLGEDPAKAVEEIELLSEEEKQKLLIEWNNTAVEYPGDQCIHELFERQVDRTPDNIAAAGPSRIKHRTYMTYISYNELNKKSTQLAQLLMSKSVQPDTVVGIMAERSLELIIGILGILKAGGAYLPIDPDYPRERIDYILSDSNANVLLTTGTLAGEGERVRRWEGKENLQIILLDFSTPLPFYPSTLPASHLHLSPAPVTSLAYVIYTSGSTGKPKGVVVEHQHILNTLYAMQSRYPVDQDDTYLLKTNYVFDVSLTELFGWFMGAGKLVILEPGLEKDPMAILKVISGRQITHINFVPSMFNSFLEMVPGPDLEVINTLKYVMVAGEVFPRRLAEESSKKFSPAVRIENIYGPTEISIYGTWFPVNEIKDSDPVVPIGTPLYNVQAYVLSQLGTLQPIGIPGELHIGGAGLARGYLNQPELTAEKFSFLFYRSHKSYRSYISKRIYNTGDLARWLPDGNIEFLGRMDHQVKIRGFRIELGEIETLLAQKKEIQDAIVLAKTVNNHTRLIAYYVTVDKNKKIEVSQLKNYLQDKLPEYMVPAAFVSLEAIPLTPNGKVNRKALLKQEIELQSSREYAAPRTETEKQLTNIWKDVLGIEKVGIHDNFFQLGGHSLLAIQMVAKIRDRLGVECPVKNIFDHSTVYDLARLFPALADTFTDNITEVKIPKKNIKPNRSIPLSDSQFMFWLFWVGTKNTRNIYRIYDVKGPLDCSRLEQAFNELLQRHESFRARFWQWKPAQKIIPPKHIPLSTIDLRGQGPRETEESLKEIRSKVAETGFDLTSPPLIRLCIIQLEEHQYKLLLVAPHIVIDEVAFYTLFDELTALYKARVSGRPLPAKRTEVRLSDYVYWGHDAAKQSLKQNIDYWQQKLDKASLLYMPGSYLLPPEENVRPYLAKLDSTLLDALAKISQQHKISLQMSLSAVITMVLHHITSQNDICIETLFENRIHQETKHLVSPMVTLLPIRIQLSRETSFPDLVGQMKQTTLEAYHHAQGPYTMPLSFLHQTCRQKDESIVLRAQKHVLGFFTWLLSRLAFPAQVYPTLFYALLVVNAMKRQAKKRSRRKMQSTAGEASPTRDSIEVYLNLMPNFTLPAGTSRHISGDVTFSPGTLPAHDNLTAVLESQQANVLYFGFLKNHRGDPLLQIRGKNFTPSALQQIATSFCEILEAVVKNPQINLLEITNKSLKTTPK